LIEKKEVLMKKNEGLHWIFGVIFFAVLLLTVGCAQDSGEQMESSQPKDEIKPTEETKMEEVKTAMTEGVNKEALLNMTDQAMNEQAPAEFSTKFETNKGDFIIKVTRDWSPKGADRFYNLVKNGFYNDVRFFRIISGFMAQFGISGDPEISASCRSANIQDDPVKESNTRGRLSFAMAGPNTRTTQVFINFGNNSSLDGQGFSPFGEVTQGMEVVDALYSDYGEGAPRGKGPSQGRLQTEGNAYLNKDFPNLDYIKKATIME
jgi:peptidyl-prolyl cis-trans isomerase A (cyclophilin A)